MSGCLLLAFAVGSLLFHYFLFILSSIVQRSISLLNCLARMVLNRRRRHNVSIHIHWSSFCCSRGPLMPWGLAPASSACAPDSCSPLFVLALPSVGSGLWALGALLSGGPPYGSRRARGLDQVADLPTTKEHRARGKRRRQRRNRSPSSSPFPQSWLCSSFSWLACTWTSPPSAHIFSFTQYSVPAIRASERERESGESPPRCTSHPTNQPPPHDRFQHALLHPGRLFFPRQPC